jgi:hypothetical protein
LIAKRQSGKVALMTAIRSLAASALVAGLASFALPGAAVAVEEAPTAQETVWAWNSMALNLTRHTATYTPPVASRAYAYVGVAAYEAVASGGDSLQTLAGQLNGLKDVPRREAGQTYDEAIVLEAALSAVVHDLFSNTGPTGHRAMDALGTKLRGGVVDGVAADVVSRSEAYGKALAGHILAWSRDDGGAVVENMGFPADYKLIPGPGHWVPTSVIVQQQVPLLPHWGKNRTFAMPDGATCPAAAPPAYSEDPSSQYYREAVEVDQTWKALTPEQFAIARFWADDAMLSVTPPGHWMSIAMDVLKRENVGLDKSVDTLARLSIAMADSFIGCWNSKFVHDGVRPITYIRKLIDPKFESVVTTPPFPEYPSGHSTQSAAAATVLTAALGENTGFDDSTDEEDGLEPRSFPSFWAAANEAAISRLYGGIHYRAAIDLGAEQGRCIAAYTVALKTAR